jgi:hypothetical protein
MATIIIPNFLTQKVVNGLNSYQYTTASTAMHTCRIEVIHREASTMTVSIVQAGSVNATLATMTLAAGSSTSGGPQGTVILQACANCVSGDTLTFVLTSSAAIDEQLNTVKALLNIHVGGLN